MHRYWLRTIAPVVAALIAGCASVPAGSLSGEDIDEMREAARAYVEAWLSNDAEAVMATFVSEPVLCPSGLPFLEGQAAARQFWWPEGSPPARVIQFESKELEAGGSGTLGYVRGTYTLVFEYDGKTHTNLGKYVHILKKIPNEGWRISHHFWDDLPQETEP